jgi:hypothetical protein
MRLILVLEILGKKEELVEAKEECDVSPFLLNCKYNMESAPLVFSHSLAI